MDQLVIAFSGRKSAGKNTAAKNAYDFLLKKTFTWKPSKCCAYFCFADDLKRFCVDVLGLSNDSVNGTDDQKNAPTKYNWETVDPYLRWKFGPRSFRNRYGVTFDDFPKKSNRNDLQSLYSYYRYMMSYEPIGLRTGPMSGREVMQMVGTELIRENFGNVWANATVNRIKKEEYPINIITDNRFPNEIEAILNLQYGYIIRLTRSPFGTQDAHDSESVLDNFNWEQRNCHLFDNSKLGLEEQAQQIEGLIDKILEHSVENGYKIPIL